MMNKNTLLFSVALLSLGACQYYSDETVFYYEDENAAPEAYAAPSQSVTSKELVIPEDLRKPKSEEKTPAQAPSDEVFDDTEEDEFLPPSEKVSFSAQTKSDTNQPQSLLNTQTSETLTATVSETNSIPVTYNETTTETVLESGSTATQFDSADITPKVYAIAATRVTNKMLDDTQKLYQQQGQKPKLLILEAKKINPQLPDGFHYANKVIHDIVDGSQNFMLVSNLDNADYVLNVDVDAFPNQGINTPIIEFTMTLQDKDGKEIDSWKQDIKQLQNDDKSWW